MKISVYIISHNYGKFVLQAIKSVINQTYSNWELILVDNSSTDNTLEIFKKFKKHKKVKIISLTNKNFPQACNIAVKKASGEYVIRLDGDDYFDHNILKVFSGYLEKNKKTALLFSDYFFISSDNKIISYEWTEKKGNNKHKILPPNGACCLIRKRFLKEVGFYREDLGAQDGLDIYFKLKKKYRIHNINLPLFYYRRHSNNLTNKELKIFSARRAIKKDNLKFKKKFSPIILIIPCRKYFDFVKNLWAQKLDGKTLLERDLEMCCKSDVIDHIVVISDTNEVLKIVSNFKKKDKRISFIKRNMQDTNRKTSILFSLKNIIKKMDPKLSGVVILRYIQTPFVTHFTLEEALSTIVLANATSSIGIESIKNEIFFRKKENLTSLNYKQTNQINKQEFYKDTTTCLAFKSKNIENNSLTGNRVVGFEVTSAESFFISSSNDLKVANTLLKEVKK